MKIPVASPPVKRRRYFPNEDGSAQYSEDEFEFMLALDRYKRLRHSPFPTCSEVLAVLKSLGYRKMAS